MNIGEQGNRQKDENRHPAQSPVFYSEFVLLLGPVGVSQLFPEAKISYCRIQGNTTSFILYGPIKQEKIRGL